MTITVHDALARLEEVTATGELAEVCRAQNVEILALFGSAVDRDDPEDVDLAVGFVHGVPHDFLAVVNALADLVPGDHLDLLDLDRADPVAQRAATDRWRVLYETAPTVHAERELKAYSLFEDTRWLRRLQQESLTS